MSEIDCLGDFFVSGMKAACWPRERGERRTFRVVTGGEYLMNSERIVGFSDPEIDMDRVVRDAGNFGMWWLIAALRRLNPCFFAVERPRRSVDRELQEILSPWR